MVKHYVYNQPKRERSGTDNACHLGGAVAGLLIGLAIKAASKSDGGPGGVGGGVLLEAVLAAGKRLNTVTSGCMAYLIFRVAEDVYNAA